MYKIGEFSLKVDLSIKTLRYYDEIGILKPSDVDIFTGYRYYTDVDVIKCEYIKLLKSLNYTLKEINECKNGLDLESINQKQMEIDENIKLLKEKYKELNNIKEKMKGRVYLPNDVRSDYNE